VTACPAKQKRPAAFHHLLIADQAAVEVQDHMLERIAAGICWPDIYRPDAVYSTDVP
jgi:hypothetical protein